MTIEQMREKIKTLYPLSPTWAHKVDNFSDKKVYAIYMRALNDKKF